MGISDNLGLGFDGQVNMGIEHIAGGFDWEEWQAQLGLAYAVPKPTELKLLDQFISTQYRRTFVTRELNIMDAYRDAITYTLGVAKAALNEASYAGATPTEPSDIASTDFLPAYVGLNQWENDVSGAGNSIATLFDASAVNVAGTAGKQLKVGSLVGAHLIVGYEQPGYEEGGTGYHVTSKVQLVKGEKKNNVASLEVGASSELKITPLATPMILVGGQVTHNSFNALAYIKGLAAETYTDTVKVLGISFLKAELLLDMLPSSYASTTKGENSAVYSA